MLLMCINRNPPPPLRPKIEELDLTEPLDDVPEIPVELLRTGWLPFLLRRNSIHNGALSRYSTVQYCVPVLCTLYTAVCWNQTIKARTGVASTWLNHIAFPHWKFYYLLFLIFYRFIGKYFLDGTEGGVLYAVFTTPPNAIPGSAVCKFSIKDLTESFQQGGFKYQVEMANLT
jgi:hypothetical protein